MNSKTKAPSDDKDERAGMGHKELNARLRALAIIDPKKLSQAEDAVWRDVCTQAAEIVWSVRPELQRCNHEPYQGRCVHCNVAFVDGKPVSTTQPTEEVEIETACLVDGEWKMRFVRVTKPVGVPVAPVALSARQERE